MSPEPLVPISSLRPLFGLVVAAAGFIMGMAAIPWVIRLEDTQWVAVSLVTAGMCRLTVLVAGRSPWASGEGLERTVGWAVLFGLLNVPASYLAAALVRDPAPMVFPLALLAMIMGAPFGLGLGFLFGVALSIPVGAYVRAWQRPSPNAVDFTLVVFGSWLALAVGLAAMFATTTMRPHFNGTVWPAPEHPPGVWLLHALACISGAAGVALAIAAGTRLAARRRFISRVALHLEPDWRLAQAPPERTELVHLPCLGGTAGECDHLLVRCEHPGDGAYRSAATEWPVAWVPRTWLGCLIVTPAPE